MDLQHIGIALMEVGKLRLAGQFLISAKEGYQSINDEITLSELQSYLCEYHLLLGDYTTALTAAETGHEIASRFGAQEYETRAAFMIGLALWMKHDELDGERKMCAAIHKAKKEELIALLLDQLNLCAKFSIPNVTCEGLRALVQLAINKYSELRNIKRQRALEELLHRLCRQRFIPYGMGALDRTDWTFPQFTLLEMKSNNKLPALGEHSLPKPRIGDVRRCKEPRQEIEHVPFRVGPPYNLY
jgi:tetratricopeptide (TPR) repeat protein